jgi:hypothetical protein
MENAIFEKRSSFIERKIMRFAHWSIIDRLHNRQQIRMSAPGTNAKFRPALKLSAYRGRAEMAGARPERRN